MWSAQVASGARTPAGTWQIAWDAAGRRISDALPGGKYAAYAWDGASNRIAVSWSDGNWVTSVYDTAGRVSLQRLGNSVASMQPGYVEPDVEVASVAHWLNAGWVASYTYGYNHERQVNSAAVWTDALLAHPAAPVSITCTANGWTS